MKRDTSILVGLASTVIVAGIAYTLWQKKSPKCGEVSQLVLARAMSVIPATCIFGDDGKPIGDENWMKFGASWRNETPGTSCALLVGWALEPWVNTRYGLASMRDEAKRLNLWVDATPDTIPCPGSAFLLESEVPGQKEREIKHVGIFKTYSEKEIESVDSGQGKKPIQKAELVKRQRSVENGIVYLTAFGETRILAGWLDSGKIDPKPKDKK